MISVSDDFSATNALGVGEAKEKEALMTKMMGYNFIKLVSVISKGRVEGFISFF